MVRKVLIFAVIACVASVLAKPGAYDLEILRQDSQFAEFEKYFDVEKVKMSYPCDRRIFSIKKTSDIPPRKPYLYLYTIKFKYFKFNKFKYRKISFC